MVIYYIGKETGDKTIKNFCKEDETRAYVSSGAVDSAAELNAVCEEARVYAKRGYIIVGLADIEGVNEDILTEKIEKLNSVTGGKVICYAPGRDDSKAVNGLQTSKVPCICDMFADKIKSKLEAFTSQKAVTNKNKSNKGILNREDNTYENESESTKTHRQTQGKQRERKAQDTSTVLGGTTNSEPEEKETQTTQTADTVTRGNIFSENEKTVYEDIRSNKEREKEQSSSTHFAEDKQEKDYYNSSEYQKPSVQPMQQTTQEVYRRSIAESYNEPVNESTYSDITRPYNESIGQGVRYDGSQQIYGQRQPQSQNRQRAAYGQIQREYYDQSQNQGNETNVRKYGRYDNEQSMYSQSGYDDMSMQSNYDASPMRSTVGVIGIINRIGTTTQALQITALLKMLSGRSCYVQMNQSLFLDDVIDYLYGVEIDSNTECIHYADLDLYKNRNQVFSGNYEHEVYDFGAIDETVPSEFFSKGTRIAVCGGTPEEVAQLTRFAPQLYDDTNIKYIFSFVPERDKNFILEMMGSKANNCYFAPYTPDYFELQESDKAFYYNLLNIAMPETRKKKRGRKR